MDLSPQKIKNKAFYDISKAIHMAKSQKSSIVLMMGAHVIRSGVQKYIIDLMEKGYISCIAMNGAGLIHDYEFAFIGKTTESVSKYIKKGQFGLWEETGRINDFVSEAAKKNKGMGEYIGYIIENENFQFRKISLLAAGYRLNIPVTIHVSIGCDIVHELPNCDGAAYGKTSYTDFLKFTHILFHRIIEESLSKDLNYKVLKTLKPDIIFSPTKKDNRLKILNHQIFYAFEDIFRYIDSVNGHLVSGQEKYLFEKVKSLPENANILEIGCNHGRSTSSMAFGCIGTKKTIFSIDTFIGIVAAELLNMEILFLMFGITIWIG